MTNNNFYTPKTIRPLYGEIVPAYQEAFAAPPWSEVTKCIDEQVRCENGLSEVAIGNSCDTCGLYPVKPAYEAGEITDRFDDIGLDRPTAWYAKRNELGLTMAALAWRAKPTTVAEEKYPDIPEMNDWLTNQLGDNPIMWLDEVFASRRVKKRDNLKNFKKFVTGLATILDCETVAYRTIAPSMTIAPRRDFADDASVLVRQVDVPDRRDFVVIKKLKVMS